MTCSVLADPIDRVSATQKVGLKQKDRVHALGCAQMRIRHMAQFIGIFWRQYQHVIAHNFANLVFELDSA